MSYRVKTALNTANLQALLDACSTWDLVGYSVSKDGVHYLIFKD
jgi:hypothetical protein